MLHVSLKLHVFRMYIHRLYSCYGYRQMCYAVFLHIYKVVHEIMILAIYNVDGDYIERLVVRPVCMFVSIVAELMLFQFGPYNILAGLHTTSYVS